MRNQNQSPIRHFGRLVVIALFTLVMICFQRNVSAVIRDGGIDPANLGKGEWIFSMTDATNKLNSHVASVTNENSLMLYYKSQGIRYIIVKAGTGAVLFNGCYAFPQFTTALANTAHANGILIFGYNRSQATNVTGEIAIADYVFNHGADGFIWDAEAEWESGALGTNNGPALAWEQCSTVRSHWPTKFLAHSPFAIISLHSTFPYKEFGYWCDAVMPQIYHFGTTNLRKSVSAAINWTDVNFYNYQNGLAGKSTNINGTTYFWTNAIKPIAPIQDVYGPGSVAICEGVAGALPDEDVTEFIDYLAADPFPETVGGYQGVNLFRCDLHGTVQWANIKAGTSGAFTNIVNNIVMDDPKASVTGAWTPIKTFYNATFTGMSAGAGSDTNSFGTNYLVKSKGTGAAFVKFTPKILTAGDYDIYQWHVYRADASAAVPFVINYDGGSATVAANQQINDGNWTLLGRYPFAAGTNGNIRVMDNFPEAGAVAIADGLKLMFAAPASVPAAPTGLAALVASTSQINLTWQDKATNETGLVVARSTVNNGPYTDVITLPRNTTNYSDTNLTINTTYYYVVHAVNYLGASANSAQSSAATHAPAIPQFSAGLNAAGQQLQVTLAGDQGYNFAIERSTNLVNWSVFTNLFSTNGTMRFSDSSTNSRNFYRARWP
jgi:hypothetical protein